MRAPHFYLRNQQGDVVAIHDAAGNVVARYEYDAWGNQLTEQIPGSIGEKNPIRYRGYYFDNETGYYYCQSRYYNPTWCRWISADVYMDTQDGIQGTNMYAYCQGDPVNYGDTGGTFGAAIHDRNNAGKYGTYYWALGFFNAIEVPLDKAKLYADTFAMANGNVDIKLLTSWKNPLSYAQSWHFNNSNTSVDSRELNYLASYRCLR